MLPAWNYCTGTNEDVAESELGGVIGRKVNRHQPVPEWMRFVKEEVGRDLLAASLALLSW
jgi:hypothetical protein